MSDPFLGNITMFGGNFAPRGWAFCSGQLLPIAQNTALFSLLGTTYGGDGRTTFALPEMRGRLPVHQGSGPGLSPRALGARFGEETVLLTENDLGSHTHSFRVSSSEGTTSSGSNPFVGVSPNMRFYRPAASTDTTFNAASVNNTGGNQPHANIMPFLCINFIIALQGIFPSRS
jgi:microcystin-dependent protein